MTEYTDSFSRVQGLATCININNTPLAIYKQEKTKTHDVERSFQCHNLSNCDILCYCPGWTEAVASGQEVGARAGPRRALCIFQAQVVKLWRAAKDVSGNPPLLTHCKHLPCSSVTRGSVRCAPQAPGSSSSIHMLLGSTDHSQCL